MYRLAFPIDKMPVGEESEITAHIQTQKPALLNALIWFIMLNWILDLSLQAFIQQISSFLLKTANRGILALVVDGLQQWMA